MILFDGVCNLCNATVNFVIDRDPRRRFRFGALQSDAGRALAARHGITELETIVLVDPDQGRAYTRSGAALRIARGLRFPWPLFVVFLAVPAFLRDAVYEFIARRRYGWFGRRETCRVPEPGIRERFLE